MTSPSHHDLIRRGATCLTRRRAILGLSSLFSAHGVSLAVAAAPTEKRLVVILLRGALDGLAAVPPYGDPDLMTLRPGLVPPQPGQPNGMLDLGGMYGLHPALTGAHDLYKANELLIIHAVAGNYRARSHFDAQDFLESGADHRLDSGWLNRVSTALAGPFREERVKALAVGGSVPLLLRGPSPVANWAPHGFTPPGANLYDTILALHRADPVTGPAIAAGMHDRGFGDMATADMEKGRNKYAFPAMASAAGAMLHAADGPRIAALEIGGWDTHTGQMNRLNGPLSQLDQGLTALKTALGDAWRQTAVLVMTEFGRTARMNGTNGTDHGTATVAFLAGGAVMGGKVLANWPGLKEGQLYENRDLAPTTDLRAMTKGVLLSHIGLNPHALDTVFPGKGPVQPLSGLIRRI